MATLGKFLMLIPSKVAIAPDSDFIATTASKALAHGCVVRELTQTS